MSVPAAVTAGHGDRLRSHGNNSVGAVCGPSLGRVPPQLVPLLVADDALQGIEGVNVVVPSTDCPAPTIRTVPRIVLSQLKCVCPKIHTRTFEFRARRATLPLAAGDGAAVAPASPESVPAVPYRVKRYSRLDAKPAFVGFQSGVENCGADVPCAVGASAKRKSTRSK